MDGDSKKSLKTVIIELAQFKQRKRIYIQKTWTVKAKSHLKLQKEIDQDIVIKMFENLKGKVHRANENGLNI